MGLGQVGKLQEKRLIEQCFPLSEEQKPSKLNRKLPVIWSRDMFQVKHHSGVDALNSNIECVNAFAVSFADSKRKGFKFHSLQGSVGEQSGD